MLPQTTATRVVSSFSLAFTLGAEDAKDGNPFAPEMYFAHPDDIADYAGGYESVKGVTLTTAQFTGSPLPIAAVATPKRRPRTSEATWQNIVSATEAHDARIDAALDATAAFMGGIYAGDLLFV